VMMWMWVSSAMKDDCLKNDRDVLISELASKGDALYRTTFTSTESGKLLPLSRFFKKCIMTKIFYLKSILRGVSARPFPSC